MEDGVTFGWKTPVDPSIKWQPLVTFGRLTQPSVMLSRIIVLAIVLAILLAFLLAI